MNHMFDHINAFLTKLCLWELGSTDEK